MVEAGSTPGPRQDSGWSPDDPRSGDEDTWRLQPEEPRTRRRALAVTAARTRQPINPASEHPGVHHRRSWHGHGVIRPAYPTAGHWHRAGAGQTRIFNITEAAPFRLTAWINFEQPTTRKARLATKQAAAGPADDNPRPVMAVGRHRVTSAWTAPRWPVSSSRHPRPEQRMPHRSMPDNAPFGMDHEARRSCATAREATKSSTRPQRRSVALVVPSTGSREATDQTDKLLATSAWPPPDSVTWTNWIVRQRAGGPDPPTSSGRAAQRHLISAGSRRNSSRRSLNAHEFQGYGKRARSPTRPSPRWRLRQNIDHSAIAGGPPAGDLLGAGRRWMCQGVAPNFFEAIDLEEAVRLDGAGSSAVRRWSGPASRAWSHLTGSSSANAGA